MLFNRPTDLFNTRNFLVLVCLLLVALVASAHLRDATAQGTPNRIAVIDVPKVLTQSNPGKASYLRLKTLQDDRIAKGRQMDEEAKRIESDLNTKRATLTPAQFDAMSKQLVDKRTAIKRFAEDAEKEIGDARDRELQALELKIKPVVDGLGKEMGLAAIFNKFESGLIFAADSIDITNTVIQRFNMTTTTTPAPAPTAARPSPRP
jgi:Skp family chaperone for outer membrane proteins